MDPGILSKLVVINIQSKKLVDSKKIDDSLECWVKHGRVGEI